jgi:hypothetical protein
MYSAIHFVELENRIISATYRNLMIKAKVVLVDKASGEQLPDPVTTIASPAPNGSLRIRLPDSVKSGAYYLRRWTGTARLLRRAPSFTSTDGFFRVGDLSAAASRHSAAWPVGNCQLPGLPPVV